MKKITEELNKVELDDDKLKFIQETAKYLGVKSQGTGRKFWEDFMLSSTKDYTNGMDFYQAVTELKVRLYRLADDSYSLQKEKLELEELRLNAEELENRSIIDERDKRRNEIEKQKTALEINRKQISIENKNVALQELYTEIADFRAIADARLEAGVPSFEEARYLDMQQRIEDRYIHHVLTGIPFTAPELGNYFKDGMIIAPPGALKKLEVIAASTTDEGLKQHLELNIEHQKILIETHNAVKNSGLITTGETNE